MKCNSGENRHTAQYESLLIQYAIGAKKTLPLDNNERFGVLVAQPVRESSVRAVYELLELAENIKDGNFICAIAGSGIIVICISGIAPEEVADIIVKQDFAINAVYKNNVSADELFGIYDELCRQIELSFYTDGAGMVSEAVPIGLFSGKEIEFISDAIISENTEGTKIDIERIFELLLRYKPRISELKKYCVGLYIKSVIRDKLQDDECVNAIVGILKAKTLSDIKNIIVTAARNSNDISFIKSDNSYSTLIRRTIQIINDNISNENLSLRWIAGTMLYMNVDYLGKLFKKETGRNFSHYVMEKRMELAKQSIAQGGSDKIYEVAESVGYGTNSQYFSQVFKKYAGVSPLEYREYIKRLKK